jgi:hypothetical protein
MPVSNTPCADLEMRRLAEFCLIHGYTSMSEDEHRRFKLHLKTCRDCQIRSSDMPEYEE